MRVITPNRRVISAWRKAVIYHIFIDRFAGFPARSQPNEPIFWGGTIPGITSKVPYLHELGVDTFKVTPFQQGVSFHGYHITDPYEVDPRFGTLEQVKDMIGTAKELNMKVIMDFVPNHCSIESPQFQHALHHKRSPFRHWFTFHHWPDSYATFATFGDLPKYNLDCPEALRYITEAARKWLRLGFDGMRLDHVVGLTHRQLRAFLTPLQAEFPHTLVTLGEAYLHGLDTPEQLSGVLAADASTVQRWKRFPRSMYRSYVGTLNGVLNFEAADYLERYANATDPEVRTALAGKLHRQTKAFPRSFLLPVHLDNQDMERFLFRVGNKVSKLKAAARLQFSLDQPVEIYYGTEVGMTQQAPFSSEASYGDLLAREPMIWDESKQNRQLFGFYQELIAARRWRTTA